MKFSARLANTRRHDCSHGVGNGVECPAARVVPEELPRVRRDQEYPFASGKRGARSPSKNESGSYCQSGKIDEF
jgi:hypothetical protein